MDNKEAIKYLIAPIATSTKSYNEYLKQKEAYELAIKVLKKSQGEWINHRNDYGHNIADCSLCGKAMQWHDEDEDGIPRYCWYCGASIKGVQNEKDSL